MRREHQHRKVRCVLMLLGALAAHPSAAAYGAITAGVYQGVVAGAPVTVLFEEEGGKYYYDKIGKTIDLNPIPEKPGFYQESEPSHTRYAEDFDPSSDNWWEISSRDDAISGIWKSGSKAGKTFKITLHSSNHEFEAQRLLRKFEVHKTIDVSGIRLEILTHPLTGVTLPRLLSGIPAKAAEKINAEMVEQASSLNEMWTECSNFDAGIEPNFVSQLWMVFEVDSSGFCGGFHPNEDMNAVSYDANTGDRINFSGWIDPQYWSSDAIEGELRKVVGSQMEYEECRDRAQELNWKQFTPWLGSDGFNFRMEESDRSLLVCENDYTLTFDEMRPFISSSHRDLYDRFSAEAAKAKAVNPQRLSCYNRN